MHGVADGTIFLKPDNIQIYALLSKSCNECHSQSLQLRAHIQNSKQDFLNPCWRIHITQMKVRFIIEDGIFEKLALTLLCYITHLTHYIYFLWSVDLSS